MLSSLDIQSLVNRLGTKRVSGSSVEFVRFARLGWGRCSLPRQGAALGRGPVAF